MVDCGWEASKVEVISIGLEAELPLRLAPTRVELF